MRGLHLIFRLALLAFIAASSYHETVRGVMINGKWGFMGLLLIAALLSHKPPRVSHVSGAGPLVIAFLAAGLLSLMDGVVSLRSGLQLASVALTLLTCSLLSAAWQTEQGRADVALDFRFAARVVIWTSFVLLVAGVNLGRAPERFSGWTDNPNSLGAMLCLLWPAVLHGASLRRGWGPLSDRVLAGMSAALLLATGSRAAVLGSLVGTVVFLGATRRLRAPALAFLALLGLGGFIFSDALAGFIEATPGLNRIVTKDIVDYASGKEGAEFKASGREAAWAVATRLVEAKPLTGYGWGAESTLLAEFDEELKTHQGNNVHNSYLSLLLQVGLLGAIPIGLLFQLAMVRGVARIRRLAPGRDPRSHTTPMLLATLVGALVHAIFESWLFAVGNLGTLIFWPAAFLLLRSNAPVGPLRAPPTDGGAHHGPGPYLPHPAASGA